MKKSLVLLLVFVLVGLPLLLAVAALVPAHLQIRGIEPDLPSWRDIEAALKGTDGPVQASYLNTASQTSPAGTLGHPGVLLRWSDGRLFLIDTGMPPEEAIAFGEPIELLLDAQPTQTFGSLATQLGDSVSAIGGIAFTHLHSDHTDGLPGICAAQEQPAVVFQAPLQFDERNYTTDMGYAALERASCPIARLGEGVLKAVPGFPGLFAVSLGGHTPGSTAYIARVGGEVLIFSGDITNDKRSVVDDLPKAWIYSNLIVPENTERTAVLRRWLQSLDLRDGVTVFPAHDVMAMAAVLPVFSD